MYKKNLILLLIVTGTLIFSYQYFHAVQMNYLSVTTFSECKTAGYDVLNTYPEVCVMPSKRFVNPNQEKRTTATSDQAFPKTEYYKNQGYIIDGEYILFTDGISHATSSTMTSKNAPTFTIVGAPFYYDINNDSFVDNIIIIKKEGGLPNHSSYYLSSCIGLRDGCTGINAPFLDVSVEKQKFVYKNGHLVITYVANTSKQTTIQKIYGLENGILKELPN